MLCKIAELITQVPEAGGMAPRCRDYRHEGPEQPDIVIHPELYHPESWPGFSEHDVAYMESGRQFYWSLLRFRGMVLHASAVALEGRAYLFSGPCGRGKSTHTGLWRRTFGEGAQVFNDDKPALRRLEGGWYAYGTPWCGKDGINLNQKWPLAGICFLEQGRENSIRRLSNAEAAGKILEQTTRRLQRGSMELLLNQMDALIREIPIFELTNRPEPAAARLSYETMRRAAREAE